MEPSDSWTPKKAPPVRRDPTLGEAAQRFVASMTMTFDMWHDGLGYDLEALAAVSAEDRDAIAALLIRHSPRDWRDIEALARLDMPAAKEAVVAALNDPDPKVRREAQRHVPESMDPKKREAHLVKALESAAAFGGLTEALAEAEEFHPPAVIDALFKGALRADGGAAVHYAALLFFLHGKAKEAFDWDHRPFFLKFNESDPKLRHAAFKELCNTIGVDASKYMAPGSESRL